jgi:preprotein translocase subunit SecD
VQRNAVVLNLEILCNRIDAFGVLAPVIVRQGRDEIVSELAGIEAPQSAFKIKVGAIDCFNRR